MIIGRKQNRGFWISSILNSIPDVLISALFAYFSNGGFLTFIGAFAALQALYLAIWLKNSIWMWIRYLVRDKKLIVQSLLDFLNENKFPEPPEFVSSADEYLNQVANDESVDAGKRVLAAGEVGALNRSRMSGRGQEYLRLSLAFDDALEEYGRKFSRE